MNQLIQNYLFEILIFIGFFFLWCFWRFAQPDRKSRFKLREADRLGAGQKASSEKIQKGPARLEGISLVGQAHEILGIPSNATKKQIQAAYWKRMKQYHPDKIGPSGSEIAVALNDAKDEMLGKLKSQA